MISNFIKLLLFALVSIGFANDSFALNLPFPFFTTKKFSRSDFPSFSYARVKEWANDNKKLISVVMALILLDRLNWGGQKYYKWRHKNDKPVSVNPVHKKTTYRPKQNTPKGDNPGSVNQMHKKPTYTEQDTPKEEYPEGVVEHEPAVTVQFFLPKK